MLALPPAAIFEAASSRYFMIQVTGTQSCEVFFRISARPFELFVPQPPGPAPMRPVWK